MSHSALSSQLAQISGNANATRSSDDAIGRGVHHSTKHGHSIAPHIAINNTKNKPSVIYPDSKSAAAADIPSSTLLENAVISLQYLEEHVSLVSFDLSSLKHPWSRLLSPNSVKYERGMNTPDVNAKVDSALKEALYLLSTAWGDATTLILNSPSLSTELESSIPASVLHVLEYMVQKYHVHYTNAEVLLLTFIPHHETFLFPRILQLIDITQFNHWASLRPYCASDGGTKTIPRRIFSKEAANTKQGGGSVILKQLCDVALKAVKIHLRECKDVQLDAIMAGNEVEGDEEGSGGYVPDPPIRKGISFLISFALAIVAETLELQQAASGVVDEKILRVVLPFLTSALEPKSLEKKVVVPSSLQEWSLGTRCPEWRSFGYILMACLVETCDLSEQVVEALLNGVVKGCWESVQYRTCGNSLANGTDDTTMDVDQDSDDDSDDTDDEEKRQGLVSTKIVHMVSDVMVIVISTLMSRPIKLTKHDDDDKVDLPSYLQLIDPKFGDYDFNSNEPIQLLGCFLPTSTFHTIRRLSMLPSALGYLAGEKNLDIKPFVAAMVAMCLSQIKIMKEKNKDDSVYCNLLLNLLSEPSLESTWVDKEESMTTSIVVSIMSVFGSSSNNGENINEGDDSNTYSKIIKAIESLDKDSCDAGVAHSIMKISSNSSEYTEGDEQIYSRMKEFLHSADLGSYNHLVDKEDESSDLDKNMDSLLPPRIALEHAVVTVRKNAVSSLLNEVLSEDRMGDYCDDDGTALMRRIASDDNTTVVSAAAKAIQKMQDMGVLSSSFFSDSSIGSDMVIGLKKWSAIQQICNREEEISLNNKKKKDPSFILKLSNDAIDTICESISLSGIIAKFMIDEMPFNDDDGFDESIFDDDTLSIILQIICCHIDIDNIVNEKGEDVTDRIINVAQDALSCSLGVEAIYGDGKILILVDSCAAQLGNKVPSDEDFEATMRRLVLFFYLQRALKDEDMNEDSADMLRSVVLSLLKSKEIDSILHKRALLLECLTKSSSQLSNLHDIIQLALDFAEISCAKCYKSICLPTIKNICMSTDDDTANFVFLSEIVSYQHLSKIAVERILSLIRELISTTELCESMKCVIIAMFYHLGHSDMSIRQTCLDILKDIGDKEEKGNTSFSTLTKFCSDLSKVKPSVRSSILMSGAASLPLFIREIVENGKDRSSYSDFLLESCDFTVNAFRLCVEKDSKHIGDGCCIAVSRVLTAMETAGEKVFSLKDRWFRVGSKVFSMFLEEKPPMSKCTNCLLQTVMVMLKGVIVDNHSRNGDDEVLISSGPSVSGNRRRSYSIGMSDGISHIPKYPDDMKESIMKCLSSVFKGDRESFECCNNLILFVLGRNSWYSGIFGKLDRSTRQSIVTSLLDLRSDKGMKSAGTLLLNLELDIPEYCYLATSEKSRASFFDPNGFFALSLISDSIRSRATTLVKDKKIHELLSVLFDILRSISQMKETVDGSDSIRQILLETLNSLHDEVKPSSAKRSDNKETHQPSSFLNEIPQYAELLVSLLAEGDEKTKPLPSSRGKSDAIKLLTKLCTISPTPIENFLIQAITNSIPKIQENSTLHEYQLQLVRDVLIITIPSYCEHATITGGVSLFVLLDAIIERLNSDLNISREGKLQLYQYIIDALPVTSGSNKSLDGSALATALAVFTAQELQENVDTTDDMKTFSSELLSRMEPSSQIAVSLYMLRYVKDLMYLLHNDNSNSLDDATMSTPDEPSTDKSSTTETTDTMAITANNICAVLFKGLPVTKDHIAYTEEQRNLLMLYTRNLLEVLHEQIFSASKVKELIRKSEDRNQSGISLNIWRELVTLQLTTTNYKFEAKEKAKDIPMIREFWEVICNGVNETLNILQMSLPLPDFLASILYLIKKEAENKDLQRKALSLLGDRSSEFEAISAESSLFIELTPDLLELIRPTDPSDGTKLVQAEAYKTIDKFARNFLLSSQNETIIRQRIKSFTKAPRLINNLFGKVKVSRAIDDSYFAMIHLLSCASLCSATLITLFKARFLPQLPNLIKPLMKILVEVNEKLQSDKDLDPSTNKYQSIKMIQLAVLRPLIAVAEHLPQFMITYLDEMLSSTCIPSMALRKIMSDDDIPVKKMVERLDTRIASCSAVRQFIPILSKSIIQCFESGMHEEAAGLFNMLELSMKNSKRQELWSVTGKVFLALIQAYDFECPNNSEIRAEVLRMANNSLISLVMKLSESQLKPIYANFQKWRGEYDKAAVNQVSSSRRHSFWSLSACMSKELKSIFLPCISTVVGDITNELEYAVSCMCTSSKLSKGSKRQKVAEVSYSIDSVSPLQPLLQCLESTLKADAHAGGNWVRSNDGQIYNMILEPLGKLFLATVPSDYPLLEEDTPSSESSTQYEKLIQGVGTEDYGNVIGCITALAASAGNEQMWKPLNHLIVEACGNDDRSEVRKAGVKCLLSVIKTLGEEYMVLLPECLPVLSELLEDQDDEIVALAKECVQQGENLLGESLEDSLR